MQPIAHPTPETVVEIFLSRGITTKNESYRNNETPKDIEVQFLAKAFVELQGHVVHAGTFVPQVVGADNGRVAARIAAADPALFNDRDIANPVFLGQVVGCRQAMSATADNDDVVFGLRLGAAPGLLPALMVADGVAYKAEN